MHRIAEEGIAAHWKYKEGKKGPAADDSVSLAAPSGGMAARHAGSRGVHVHPEGGSVPGRGLHVYPARKSDRAAARRHPIDFAYAIHSDVGNTCVGSKVNGRIVPLRSSLRNGDIVEIITQSGHEPSKDWLAFVKTSRARNKIKHVINASERVKAIEIGQKYLDKEARRLGVQMARIGKADLETVAGEYGYSKMEDLYAALGYGKFSARQVLAKLAPATVKDDGDGKGPATPEAGPVAPRRPPPASATWMAPMSSKSAAWTTSWSIAPSAATPSAANPSSVTSRAARAWRLFKMCSNVQSLMYDVERKIEVEWARAATEAFPVRIVVLTDDRPGMLNQLTTVLSGEDTNIRSLEAKAAWTRWRRGGDDGGRPGQEAA